MLKLSRDINGNKTCRITGNKHARGFSVQTLGNMPETHRMTSDDFKAFIALNEMKAYIKSHGTKRQKALLGI